MTKEPDLWFPFNIGAYVRKTTHLETIEHGAYLLLMLHYYVNGPLADDDKQLAVIARLSPHRWKKFSQKVREFFVQKDGKLFHERIERELADARLRSAGNIQRSQLAARARWDKNKPPPGRKDDAPSMLEAMHDAPPKQSLAMPNHNHSKIQYPASSLESARATNDNDQAETSIRALIKAFDDARAGVWGESQRRPFPDQVHDRRTAQDWIAVGATAELVQQVAVREFEGMLGRGADLPRMLSFLNRAVRLAVEEAKKPPADPERARWRARAASFLRDVWSEMWGPKPGQPGCKMPRDLQQQCLARKAG